MKASTNSSCSPSSSSVRQRKSEHKTVDTSSQEPSSSPFLSDLSAFPIQCNILSLQDIRIALDDILIKFFTVELGWKEDNRRTDLNLLSQFVANVIALVVVLYSYFFGFEASRTLGQPLCILYFFVVLLSTVVNWQLGPMPKFSGMSSSSPKETVKVETNIEAPSTLYSIIAVYQSESEANKPRTIHLKKPVETWFHADGSLAAEAIYKDLLLLASPGK
ncbi:hypothetical protein MDAP_001292 [Mitosporidium daphniae]